MDQPNSSNFLTLLKTQLKEEGYLAPEIEQFISSLDQIEQGQPLPADIEKRLLALISGGSKPLPFAYLVSALLSHFSFSAETIEKLAREIISLLRARYAASLSVSDYEANFRIQAWNVLSQIKGKVGFELQDQIKKLSLFVRYQTREDDFIKERFLRVTT